MAKAVIMLAMIKQKLDGLEKDCIKFDEKENLQAGIRLRTRLRKVRKMMQSMVDDMMYTTKMIKKKRGVKDSKYYWDQYRKDGRAAKWNEKSTAYLRTARRKRRDAKADKIKKLQDS